VKDVLSLLCYMTALRMRRHGFYGRVIHFYAAAPWCYSIAKQRALSVPTADERLIYKTCVSIAEQFRRQEQLPEELQFIGVSVGKLCPIKEMPLSLFDKDRRREKLVSTMDRINNRYGDLTVYWGDLQLAKEKIIWNAANRGMFKELEAVG
jgi:hypothetical protein